MKSPVVIVKNGSSNRGVIYHPKLDEETVVKKDGNSIVFSTYGAGWVSGEFVSKPSDLIDFFEKNHDEFLEKILSSQKGSLTLYIQNGREQYIIPDPLSGSMLFYYKDKHNWYFSSDLESLLLILKKFGISPKKNFEYLTELISTGNGGFVPTSYVGISVLEPFEYVKIKDGLVSILKSSEFEKFFSPLSEVEKKDYFEIVRAEFIENIKAVSKSKIKNKVAHLTGGFDSRLVVSSLISSGVDLEEFSVMCSGNDEINDKVIAKKLAAHYELFFTNSDGRNNNAPYEPGRALFPSMGMVRADVPSRFLDDYVVMSGGYGGLLRSVYGSRASLTNGSLEEVLKKLFGMRFCPDLNNGIVSSRFYDFYYSKFESYINKISKYGLQRDSILDYIFATKRNRYYIGSISALHSKYSPRVDPLYSVNALRLALNLTDQERRSNVLGLNLLRSFDENMASLPFDVNKVDEFYNNNYGPIEKKDFIEKELKLRNIIKEREVTKISPTKKQIELAKSMNSSLLQIVYLQEVQEKSRLILKKNRKLIEENLNWKVVNRYYQGELKNRVHIRTAFSIYDSLNWYD